MIKLIGFKRVVLLACLLALNLSVLGVYFFGVGPMLNDAIAQRDAVNGEIATLKANISNIKQDLVYMEENLPRFNELKEKGFFLSQDRFTINRMLDELRIKTGISSFAFSVSDVMEVSNNEAAAVDHKLISSRVKIDSIVSPYDMNIYLLVQGIARDFPNAVRIQSMNITRAAEVNEVALEDIAAGRPVNFVRADIEFDWITMVPKAETAPAGFRGQ